MTNTDLIQQAQQALQSGERERARRLLIDALHATPRNAAIWLLMSQAVEQPAHKLDCVMRALAIEPENAAALAELARLNPLAAPPTPPVAASQTPSVAAPQTPSVAASQTAQMAAPQTAASPSAAPSSSPRVRPALPFAQPNRRPAEAVPAPAMRPTRLPGEWLEIERRRRRGYRNLMLAGALIISMFCGIVLLTLTVTQVVPRGQALRRERLSVTPTSEPVLYQATLWCPPCEQANSPVILWEKVGDGISRGGKVGELPHNTTVNVHKEVWSTPEGRTYYRISAQGQQGWVPETFIRREPAP